MTLVTEISTLSGNQLEQPGVGFLHFLAMFRCYSKMPTVNPATQPGSQTLFTNSG